MTDETVPGRTTPDENVTPLTFGTAGLRGPLGPGPGGMNVDTVVRTTAGLASWLQARCLGGSTVVVGRDARHGSREFADATAEVLAAAGFDVVVLPRPLPTPVLAFAVRRLRAAAGVQITASHNPATDNGYKVYTDGGAQLIAPADREIEHAIAAVGPANAVPRAPATPTDEALLTEYLARVAALPRGSNRDLRIALTPLHGVGGDTAIAALTAAGFTDLHTVTSQFDPDPDFPTVRFPNPEEDGATDALLELAESVGADLAIALDPDADRCAVGVPGPDGWRMLRGDETGVLLGDHVLSTAGPDPLVATTIVSSQLLAKVAAARGARFAETLTGFKWLVRAGAGLVYAYEEALGHCVDPEVVRDKDGISAAVLMADLAAGLKARGRSVLDVLDDYAVEFGVHAGDQVSRRVGHQGELADLMARLRAALPRSLAGDDVTAEDLLARRGALRTDAVVLRGERTRMVVRPSGTEPKLKCYLEVVVDVEDRSDLDRARAEAATRLRDLRDYAREL
ncbi:phospho-sugar mutase [Rhodococcus maanshanensis]|uniref:Phosphomannomutase n=1 Tax=Rhodococcus maanshanensis TaxID=183556 RepID=A0A1H7XNM5_9NOCA|nr:phospho-sugar mutase [Rhodococcus maanshanensis]SEM35234.1 phosphomannomutase [Rhodococcus maanshanensis]